jgi:hypothetical protein
MCIKMGERGPKPIKPDPMASDEAWADYRRYLRIWQEAGKRVSRGIAVAGIVGAVSSHGLSADALSGDVADGKGVAEGWKTSAQTEQRGNQARTQRGATRDIGRQRGGSSGKK